MKSYFCETDLAAGIIDGAVADGSMEFWRLDADGRRWFKTTAAAKLIRGVKPGWVPGRTADIQADDDVFDDAFESALRHYKAVVEARAAGVDIPPEFGAQVLADAGKSMVEFNQDVAVMANIFAELAEDE